MKEKICSPEDILPSGDDYAMVVNPFTGMTGKARKGTVAATLNNIALLDRLLLNNRELEQIQQINEAVTKLIPSLKFVGIFDLFKLEEWFNDAQRLGRIYVVALYLKNNPEEMTQQLAAEIKKIQQSTKSIPLRSLLEEIIP